MNLAQLTRLENESIRSFVASCGSLFTGTVLDWGCGRQPYRNLVESFGGTYLPYDRADFPANMSGHDIGTVAAEKVETILCTQVIQFATDPVRLLEQIKGKLRPGGHLILTGPETWPVVNVGDLWRFTVAGISLFLSECGYTVTRVQQREAIRFDDFSLWLGWGVVARA